MRFIFEIPTEMREAVDAKAASLGLDLAKYLRRLITQDTGVEAVLGEATREQRQAAGRASVAGMSAKQRKARAKAMNDARWGRTKH